MAQLGLSSKDDTLALIDTCFAELTTNTEALSLTFADPAFERHVQQRLIDERDSELRGQVSAGVFEPEVEGLALDLLNRRGLQFDKLPVVTQHDILEGVARAMIEQLRLHEFRLHERLLRSEPHAPLFAKPRTATEAPSSVSNSSHKATVIGPTVGQTVERYLKAKRKTWAAKTPTNRARQAERRSQQAR